jgi:hypothetical protein
LRATAARTVERDGENSDACALSPISTVLVLWLPAISGDGSWCEGQSYGNFLQSGGIVAVAGEDGDVVVRDSQIVSGERGGTNLLAKMADAEEQVPLQL